MVSESLSGISGNLPDCRFIPASYKDYHNIIAAADMLVGKAGGATVAEVIGYGKKMLYAIRPNYRENELLVGALEEYANSLFVETETFRTGEWISMVDRLDNQEKALPSIATNGAEVVVNRILRMLEWR